MGKASPEFLKAYAAATGQTVEKPGQSVHTPKFDRCVREVEAKGGATNAYAVCTAMLGSEAFKSMDANDPAFSKEVEEFMRTLGISGAGPVPNSLMARQDLEGSSREKSFAKHIRKEDGKWNLYSKKTGKLLGSHDSRASAERQEAAIEANKMTKDGSASLSVWYHDEDGNRKCEVYQNVVDAEAAVKRLKEMGYMDVYVVSSQDDTTTKAGDKMYLIRTNGMEYARFDTKADAEECLSMLTAQGQFAVMIEETVVSGTEKGRVEATGRQLNTAVREAAKAEDTEERETLADRIKNIQLKRQRATIAERSKSVKSGSKEFKRVWGGITGAK